VFKLCGGALSWPLIIVYYIYFYDAKFVTYFVSRLYNIFTLIFGIYVYVYIYDYDNHIYIYIYIYIHI
jgi:hypothetical protein